MDHNNFGHDLNVWVVTYYDKKRDKITSHGPYLKKDDADIEANLLRRAFGTTDYTYKVEQFNIHSQK